MQEITIVLTCDSTAEAALLITYLDGFQPIDGQVTVSNTADLAEVEADEPTPQPEQVEEPTPQPEPPALTLADVKSAMITAYEAKTEKDGSAKANEWATSVLKQFGAEKVSDLTADQFGKAMEVISNAG